MEVEASCRELTAKVDVFVRQFVDDDDVYQSVG